MSDFNGFVWIDMETTGLDPRAGVPIELGFILTDPDLVEIDRASWQIFEDEWDERGYYEAPKVDQYVLDMHDKSGLWREIDLGKPLAIVQEQVVGWLKDKGVTKADPMCGSSVQFDRLWMEHWLPDAFNVFSYRNIDISTLKELMKRLSPEIYALMDEDGYGDKPTKRGIHRVLPDLEDTISEFKFYRKEFLYVPSDFN